MKRFTRLMQFAAAAVALSAIAFRSSKAQSHAPFGVTDLSKLRWLEGTWRGSAQGEANVYERYRFVNDSTIEITYFTDAAMGRPSGSGRVYLTVGRIYHTFGPGRWGATRVDQSGVHFVPQVNARNTFSWSYQGPDTWTATRRSSASGREAVTVYQMERVRP
jgi:hypothetical protein